jgi:cytochrome oxidase assembly protein ShyY1
VLKVVVSRRWLTALAVAALFALACVYLGRWQWHRHEDKAARADRIESHYSAAPVPLSRALPGPDAKLPPEQEWTMVTATGRYDGKHLMLVRNRPNNGVFGYEVAVPLKLADGGTLLVDRGWIPNGRTAADPSSTPATPAGEITVTGWLRPGEPSFGRQLPNGMLASINLQEAQTRAGVPLYGGYVIKHTEVAGPGDGAAGSPGKPAAAPQPLEKPDTDLGPHLAYAFQWWLAAPVGFVLVLVGARREHLEGPVPASPDPGDRPAPARTPRAKKVRIWDEEDE